MGSASLIYHYFDSKGALLKTILEESSPLHLIRTLKPQMVSQPTEVLLRQVVERILTLTDDVMIQRIIRVSLPELLHNSTISGIGLSAIHEATKFLEEFFEAKMESGELRHVDPSLAAQTFMGSVMGFIVRRQILRDPMALQYSNEQIEEYVVSATLRGLLPD
jgi:AcrR family transcriptional regulator